MGHRTSITFTLARDQLTLSLMEDPLNAEIRFAISSVVQQRLNSAWLEGNVRDTRVIDTSVYLVSSFFLNRRFYFSRE
jgi:hypothetical protein